MSKFYGMIQGGRGEATRCGHRFIKSAVQSYDGSVITELEYNEIGELLVKVSVAENESSAYGRRIFCGTFEDFIKQLEK